DPSGPDVYTARKDVVQPFAWSACRPRPDFAQPGLRAEITQRGAHDADRFIARLRVEVAGHDDQRRAPNLFYQPARLWHARITLGPSRVRREMHAVKFEMPVFQLDHGLEPAVLQHTRLRIKQASRMRHDRQAGHDRIAPQLAIEG